MTDTAVFYQILKQMYLNKLFAYTYVIRQTFITYQVEYFNNNRMDKKYSKILSYLFI